MRPTTPLPRGPPTPPTCSLSPNISCPVSPLCDVCYMKMMTLNDHQLLTQYVNGGSQDAFAELVTRYLNFVYSAALRQVRISHLAEEVAQMVFTTLARKAASLPRNVVLAGWLHRTARY